jgi:polysaccharide biosynthesis transport protein
MTDGEQRAPLDLRSTLGILRRRWVWVIVPIMVAAGAQVARTARTTPLYRAQAELLLEAKSTSAILSGINDQNSVDGGYYSGRVLATEIRVIESEQLRRTVSKQLGFQAVARGTGDLEASVLAISAVDSDPQKAALVANAFAKNYIEFRRQQSIQDLNDASKELASKVSEYDRSIEALTRELTQNATGEAADPAVQSSIEARRAGLLRQKESFQTRIDALTVDASLKTGGASVLTPAYESTVPFTPLPARNLGVGILSGLVLGLSLALLRELLDNRIRTRDQLAALGRVPVLGLIPKVKRPRLWNRKKVGSLPVDATEAYRSLRSAISFMSVDQPIKVLQVTSPNPGDGKSTTVKHLAESMSQAGHTVLVIDADLRSPSLGDMFGVVSDHGFSNVLSGQVGIATASRALAFESDLTVLTAGPVPPNPSELLGSRRASNIVSACRRYYDIVLIDGPPVLSVTDSLLISRLVDATLVVTRAGVTTEDELTRTLAALGQAKANVIGSVLNSVKHRRFGRGRYGGYGLYGHYGRKPRKAISAPAARTLDTWVPHDSDIWVGSAPSEDSADSARSALLKAAERATAIDVAISDEASITAVPNDLSELSPGSTGISPNR